MDIRRALIQRILQLCDKKAITVNALADRAGIPHSTVKNILYGRSQNPGIVTIKKLCDGLEITITDFFDTEEFKNLEQEIK